MQKKTFYALLLAACCATSAVAQDAPAKRKVKVKRKQRTEAPTREGANPAGTAAADTDVASKYARTITQDDLRQHLTILASDAYEGRETGEKGQKMAADYISKQFQELGLTGPVQGSDNPYLQHLTMVRSTWAEGATLKVGTQTYKWLTDFYGFGNSPFQQETAIQPVFAGYGIEQEGYSDYAGLGDVKGKDLVILMGEPMNAQKQPVLGTDGAPSKWGTDYRAKAAMATQKGRPQRALHRHGPQCQLPEAGRAHGSLHQPAEHCLQGSYFYAARRHLLRIAGRGGQDAGHYARGPYPVPDVGGQSRETSCQHFQAREGEHQRHQENARISPPKTCWASWKAPTKRTKSWWYRPTTTTSA